METIVEQSGILHPSFLECWSTSYCGPKIPIGFRPCRDRGSAPCAGRPARAVMGDIGIDAPAGDTASGGLPGAARKDYHDPEDVLFVAMRQRYEAYSRDPANLTAVAYFCLTCLEGAVPKKGRRKAVAELYGISYRDLQEIGALADQKGGRQGSRKAKALESELTEEETAFLADMVRLMIRRRGELAAGCVM